MPLVLDPRELTREATDNYRVVARLHAGVTLDQARQAAGVLATRLAASYPGNGGMTVDSLLDDAVRDVRPALLLLLGAVSLLMVIACANLSNLFAARGGARRGEFAVRLALGASRRRLLAQTFAEATPVLLSGGLAGMGLAEWAVREFVANRPAGLPRVEGIALSAPVVAFSLALLVLTGLAASAVPAIQAWASDFAMVIRDGGRTSTSGRGRARASRAAAAAQIAFALPLLVGAGLLLRSAINVLHVDPGFRSEQVTTFKFEVSRSRHRTDPEVADYYARVLEAVRAVPGVTSAGLANRIPLSGGQTNPVYFENATSRPDELTNVDTRTVSPDYFTTLGIRFISGRGFNDHDDASGPAVAIIDERVAHAIWPGESAIGRRFREPAGLGGRWVNVVGVVRHVRSTALEVDPAAQVYWSYRQWTQDRMVLAVRSVTAAAALTGPVIRAIRSVDTEQSVYDVRTMTEIVDLSEAQRWLTTLLMVGFSGLALLLAAVGVYGVVACNVAQRVREFAIRTAIGASPGAVTQQVVWQGLSIAMIGVAAGLVLSMGAAGLVTSLVYGVAARDALTLLGAALFLLLVAGLASYIPARRAAAVDPGVTLRAG